MVNKEVFDFLSAIKNNNYREWFQENKKTYEACKQSFIHTVELLISGISQFDKSIAGLLPKDCIFRINRDIRFSKDKSPYKTNFGAFITPGGRNSGKAGYYIHVEPGNSFLAGGIYMPPSPVLKAIRQEIFDNYEEFLEIVNDEEFIRNFGELEGEKLKTRPKGFPEDFEGIEFLKFKNYTVMDNKSDDEMTGNDFYNSAIDEFKALFPLIRFLNNIEKQ